MRRKRSWCNGNTTVSKTAVGGSSPPGRAKVKYENEPARLGYLSLWMGLRAFSRLNLRSFLSLRGVNGRQQPSEG